jgi:hypothetical protein
MALGSTQPLTEMSTGIFPGGKAGLCVGLKTLPPSCADCLNTLRAGDEFSRLWRFFFTTLKDR